MTGCSTQPAYRSPLIEAPVAWSEKGSTLTRISSSETWWKALNDPAVDGLVDAALQNNPTLLQALARVDEAKATVIGNAAHRLPQMSASASATRSRDVNADGLGNSLVVDSSTTSVGPTIHWEVDLFGRIRQSADAARSRLDARSADAQGTRLELAAEITDAVLAMRACHHLRVVLEDDVASRQKTLSLIRHKLAEGFVAPLTELRIASDLASARIELVMQIEQCTRHINALVALSGKSAEYIQTFFLLELPAQSGQNVAMPVPPDVKLAMPATILTAHPSVISAEREVAATWAEIGVTRADRLPHLDLTGLLTRQWLSAAGQTLKFTNWSLGPALTASFFDGGLGTANVDIAEARYRQALAGLQLAVRNSARDIENALSASASAQGRRKPAEVELQTARAVLAATLSQWNEGAVSLLELEEARRQYGRAQDDAISTARDIGQAWVALIKATGNGISAQALVNDNLQNKYTPNAND